MRPAPTGSSTNRRLESLGIFVELEKQLRHAENLQSLFFILVNETHNLAKYRQAMLWKASASGSGRLVAVSGLPTPDNNAPFSTWISKVASTLNGQPEVRELSGIRTVSHQDLPVEIGSEWSNWLPGHLLWVPLRASDGSFEAALLLARDQAWTDTERLLLSYFSDAALHAWIALQSSTPKRFSFDLRKKKYWISGLLAALLISLFPVSQTALVPAEVIPQDPVYLRAPMDGVVEQLYVQPNQVVQKDTLLLRLDATRLNSQLDVAQKAREVAESEYRQVQQQGLSDSRANANLALLRGQVEQYDTEIEYLRSLLSRLEIRAPVDGVVIFDDVNDWIGRPLTTGERILMVADPDLSLLEMRVPVDDLITFEEGARVTLFLNTDPHRPVEGSLVYASYQASLTPEGILAYRVVADFSENTRPLRIGLQGTAKLYGDQTRMILYLLRRPLQTIRQMVGL